MSGTAIGRTRACLIQSDTVYELSTTCPSESVAHQLADRIVDARLAACVQIAGPIQSVYRWQGTVHREVEFKLTAKTLGRCLPLLQALVLEHHPYQVPEWIVSRVALVSPSYQEWIREQIIANVQTVGADPPIPKVTLGPDDERT